MKIYIFLLFFIFCSCSHSREKKLEEENITLKIKVDSMQSLANDQLRLAQEKLYMAKQNANKVMDSLILAQDLKVIRVNENCQENDRDALLQSIKAIELELVQFEIEVIYNDINECGYELHHGKRTRTIEGIMDEVGIKNEVELFYNIKLNDRHSDLTNKTNSSGFELP